MKSQGLLGGTLLLTGSDLLNRLLGLVFQSLLIRHGGPESLGLLQMGLPLLSLLAACISTGLPLAIAKLVAEAYVTVDLAKIQQIMRVSFFSCTLFAGGIFLLFSFYQKEWLPVLFSDGRACHPFMVMFPILFLTGWSAVLRGFFYGSQILYPPAVASVLEQVFRIAFSLLAFQLFSQRDGVAGAMIGGMSLVIGEFAGCIYLAYAFIQSSTLWKTKGRRGNPFFQWRQTFLQLYHTSLPITGNSLANILMYVVEAWVIPFSLLQAGYLPKEATALFGLYAGVAVPLFFFATVFTDSLGITLVAPVSVMVTGEQTRKLQHQVRYILRTIAGISFLFSLFLLLFAPSLTRIFYQAPEASSLLIHLAPFLFFVCLQMPLASLLQAVNRSGNVLLHGMAGDLLRLALILLWGSRPSMGIYGIVWAANLSNVLVACLHGLAIRRYFHRIKC